MASVISSDELRVIGRVISVHGLQGTLKVEPLSDFPERFENLETIFVRRSAVEIAQYGIKNARWSNSILLLTLREVRTREEAEQFRGAEICVAEQDRWTLPDGVYYESDLIGFSGQGEDGASLGALERIHGNGAQSVLQFQGPQGELLVPFVSEWVGRVDTELRTIEVLNWRRLTSAEEIEPRPADHDH